MTQPDATNKLSLDTLKEYQFNVISALYHYGQVFLYQIQNILTPDCLITDKGRFFYTVLVEIVGQGFEVDAVFFEEYSIWLGYQEYFKENKGETLQLLETIKGHKVSHKNALESARILARKHYKDKIARGLFELQGTVQNLHDNTPSDVTSNTIIEFVRNTVASEGDEQLEPLGATVQEYVEDMLNGEPSAPGLNTVKFPLFEELIGGLTPGTVTCICARMKQGKSICNLNLALNVAQTGVPVLYLDLEMQKNQIMHRALANLAQVRMNDIKYKTFIENEESVQRMKGAAEALSNLPLTWRKAAGLTVTQYLSIALRWLAKHVGFNQDGTAKPCLLVVDYIKLSGDFGNTSSKKDFALLGFIASSLKDFANNYGLPIITAVQLNRGAVDQKVSTANIYGSDQIAQYLDTLVEFSRKTETEMAQDNADAGFYMGNCRMSQLCVRDAEAWQENDYVSLDFIGPTMTLNEMGRRSHFAKPIVKKTTVKKDPNEIIIPGT